MNAGDDTDHDGTDDGPRDCACSMAGDGVERYRDGEETGSACSDDLNLGVSACIRVEDERAQ